LSPADIAGLVGFHVSAAKSRFPDYVSRLHAEGVRWFQIFLQSPRTYQAPRASTVLEKLEAAPEDATIIAHAPYVLSPASAEDSEPWRRSLEHALTAADVCAQAGIRLYVTHTGSPGEGRSRRQGLDSLETFCQRFLEETEASDVILALENGAGSKEGPQVGFLPVLHHLVRRFDHPRLRLCYDTEHAFASGFDIGHLGQVERVLEWAAVVHLNAVPVEVRRGGHLDRHGKTALEDSQDGPGSLLETARLALERRIPLILERDGLELMLREFGYLCREV